ncbi:MAG: hypothetical protein OHK0052_07110 [Anaerolineales bacterium]
MKIFARIPLWGIVVLFGVTLLLALQAPILGHWRWYTGVQLYAPVFVAIWLGYRFTRFVQQLDELQQRIYLEALAFSFGNTLWVGVFVGLSQHNSLSGANWLWLCALALALWLWGLRIARRRYE